MGSTAPASLHPHHDELVTPEGAWRYTNALADSSSPYLLQHAHNPVDWKEWGPAALEEARRRDVPIFLSVGYSTCYWCHVMERLVFENPKIAEQLNQRFVCIKVDREQRPDLDEIYMASVQVYAQLTSGRAHGGWPMSVFLTPPGAEGPDDAGLKPFFAGTYFPPEPTHGMPSFPDVIEQLSTLWQDKREQVIRQANTLGGYVQQFLAPHPPQSAPEASASDGGDAAQAAMPAEGVPGTEPIRDAANALMRIFDPEHGGFGHAPKFPQPTTLDFLIAVQRSNHDAELWKAIAWTLERMGRGGMYDQVGGGFHRYSVDARWLVPHFEKMLYDNAQLIETCLRAQGIQPDHDDPALYSRIAAETCDYILREMTHPEGGFYSAQDAEVDAREGVSYLWQAEQVREAIGDPELAELAITTYGLDRGPNFQDPHAPDAQPANVLFLPKRLDVLAAERGMGLDDLLDKRREINRRLLSARNQRPQPATDDKILTGWNGLMIAAMSRAALDLGRHDCLAAAENAARLILERMREGDGADTELLRVYRQGKAEVPGFLEDYAGLIRGLIGLHRATGESSWLEEAAAVAEAAERRFSAAEAPCRGGWFDTRADQQDLLVRGRGTHDGAVPTGNSVMVHNMLDLYELTGQHRYRERAEAALRSFSSILTGQGAAMLHMLHALLRLHSLPDNHTGQAAPADAAGTATSEARLEIEPGLLTFDESGQTAQCDMTVHIPEGYHLHAEPAEHADSPQALHIEFAEQTPWQLTVAWPEPQRLPLAATGETVSAYQGSIRLHLHLDLQRAGDGDTPPPKTLRLHWQLCTERACLAPSSQTVTLSH